MQRELDSACTEQDLNDLEDPKQQKATEEQRLNNRAFLTADLRRVSSKLNEQAGAKSNNTAAMARATFRALDTDGDGNCHTLFHSSPKLCHLLFLVSRSCPHDHLSIEHLHQDHLNLLDVI